MPSIVCANLYNQNIFNLVAKHVIILKLITTTVNSELLALSIIE